MCGWKYVVHPAFQLKHNRCKIMMRPISCFIIVLFAAQLGMNIKLSDCFYIRFLVNSQCSCCLDPISNSLETTLEAVKSSSSIWSEIQSTGCPNIIGIPHLPSTTIPVIATNTHTSDTISSLRAHTTLPDYTVMTTTVPTNILPTTIMNSIQETITNSVQETTISSGFGTITLTISIIVVLVIIVIILASVLIICCIINYTLHHKKLVNQDETIGKYDTYSVCV